jgi:low temperature requirement protein LtrA
MAGFQRFLEPPRLRTATAERYEERHATWLELFLDLVFVVAIAELGSSFAHHVSARGFLIYLGLFVPIVWAWAGFTFYATRFDTDDLVYRVVTLFGMFCVAALATTVPAAFEGKANGFALAYACIRIVIVLLYVRARRDVPEARQLTNWFNALFSIAIVLWFVSLAVAPPWKYVLWTAALALELGAPPRAWRMMRDAPIHPSHIPERFGLLTIIVLGEAVIAVVIGTVNVSWTALSGTTAFAGFLVAASLWWIYFEYLDSSVVARDVLRGMTFVYSHFLVVIGIAAMGVGVRLAVLSAGPGNLYAHSGWVLAAGAALCMTGLGVIQLVTGPAVLDADVRLRFATASGAIVLAALTNVLSPVVILWLLAVGLLAQVAFELATHERHRPAPLAEQGADAAAPIVEDVRALPDRPS